MIGKALFLSMTSSPNINWNLYEQTASYGSTASATSHTVVLPRAPSPGNLLLLASTCDSLVTTPTGWTLEQSNINQTATYLWSKVAKAGDTASITVAIGSSDSCALFAFEVKGRSGISDRRTTTGNLQGNGGSSLQLPLTTSISQPGELIVAIVGMFRPTNQYYGPMIAWSSSFVGVCDVTSSLHEELAVGLLSTSVASTYFTTASWTTNTTASQNGIVVSIR